MKLLKCVACVAALALSPVALHAGAITGGDLVVYRIGTGSPTALVNTGNPVFVDEFNTTGTLQTPINSIPLNASGAGTKLIASGVATSEGLLTVSPDGQFVALTGYDTTTGGSSLAGSSANRSVAVIPVSSGAPSYTSLSDFASGNNPRSAVTTDGSSLWIAGGSGGVRYTTAGSSTSTQINTPTALVNFRQVNIFAGQLYASDSSGGGSNTIALGAIGSGTPSTAGQAFTGLPGLPPVASSSDYAFFFADLDGSPGVDTLYIADDSSANAGLTKYSLVGGTWTSNGKVGTSTDAYRGLTGYISSGGPLPIVHLFAVRKGGSAAAGGGELVSLDDASGFNGAFSGTPTLLATAPTNEAFRGVAYIPVAVPEPSTWVLVVVGVAAALIAKWRPRMIA